MLFDVYLMGVGRHMGLVVGAVSSHAVESAAVDVRWGWESFHGIMRYNLHVNSHIV